MAGALEVGDRLRAKYSDGEFYGATVQAVSDSKKRAKAPVKVRFDGYDAEEDTWLALADLKSKKLPKTASAVDPKAKTKAKAKAKARGKSESEGKLAKEEVELLDKYWRASNYLTVAQIYLRGQNPLLKTPLQHEDIKARLLGHFGTCPGLNFVYTHCNRIIKQKTVKALFVAGPGHGGPGAVAHVFMEGTYSEKYPEITHDLKGMGLLVKQFSWPRGIPSHIAPFCPGSLHEGGELGYCLLHAHGAVLDNPELVAICVVGDGEAETGACATSWHGAKFNNPKTDGAVLPVLHLNGGRIGAATVLSRMPHSQLVALFRGLGYRPLFVEGDEPAPMHQKMAAAMDTCIDEIRKIQKTARDSDGDAKQVPWPMIVLRSPKGWMGPKEIKGQKCEGTFRSHQVPVADPGNKEEDLKALDVWLKSYKPEELFNDDGSLKKELVDYAPPYDLAMSRCPQANGGELVVDLKLPDLAAYEFKVPSPGVITECTPVLSKWFRDIVKENPTNFRIFCPDEMTSNKMSAVFEATGRNGGYFVPNKELDSPFDARDGRVMEILSEHFCQGWIEAYTLSGRHGVFPCYESFAQVCDSMVNQHCKWLKASLDYAWRKKVPSVNYILTSHTWRQDHNGYSHQSPGFIDNAVTKPPVTNVFLPPDANTLLVVARWCMASRQKVNLMVCGKHPMPQWLTLAESETHCKAGAGSWKWAGTEGNGDADVVLCCAGDVPTLEVMATAHWFRKNLPSLKTRVVNVIDLFTLSVPGTHENSHSEEAFEGLYGTTVPVVMFYHGTPATVNAMLYHRRSAAGRFGVHGYIEEGSTTTPFDLTVFNKASRFHIIIDALQRVGTAQPKRAKEFEAVITGMNKKLEEHLAYIWDNGEDMPEIRNWAWSA